MRLFTAIDLPTELLFRLERLLSLLRPEALIKWSPLDNLHITTKFIGEWPENRVEEISEALTALKPREAFEIEVRDLGWFPDERAPRVLWAGVHAGPELLSLVSDIEECLAVLGIAKDSRPFSPHLTLARIKNPAPLRVLRERVSAKQSIDLGKFYATHFCLFRSDPGSNASIYSLLRSYQFETALAAS